MGSELSRRLLEIENFPTLPVIMDRLLDAVQDETTSAQDLTRILERDIAISTRVLRLSNSAFYGLRYPIDSIQRAVVVVGFQAVRMLALATSVFDSLSRHKQFAFNVEEFWTNSLGTAKAAQLLARNVPGVESPESCFTAGLLLNIGKYALSLTLQQEYTGIVRRARGEKKRLCALEMECLGMTYAEAGALLVKEWRLPTMMQDVVENHIDPERYAGDFATENAIMALSMEIARAAEFGNAGDYSEPRLSDQLLVRYGAQPGVANDVLQVLGEYRDEAREFLSLLHED
jgi:HD-like signal output (HDOD) protein